MRLILKPLEPILPSYNEVIFKPKKLLSNASLEFRRQTVRLSLKNQNAATARNISDTVVHTVNPITMSTQCQYNVADPENSKAGMYFSVPLCSILIFNKV